MPEVIANIDQVTPEWLTQVLSEQGALPRGRVISVGKQVADSNTATAARLEIAYSAEAPQAAPRHLFVKLGRRRIEVEFYQMIGPAMADPPAPRCYAAAYAPESGRSYLLFDDLSATHSVPEGVIPPTLADTERLIDALATFHAHWWQHPRLQGDIAQIAEDVPGYVVGVARANFADFVDFLGDRLSERRHQIYERIFVAWPLPALVARRAAGQHMTLVHGDTHYWNFLAPRDPAAERVRIIDWAVWHIGVGPSDLAYMIALFWFPERRTRMEQGLVRRYHARLIEHGVTEYSWEQCWLDYRTAVIFHLFWPIFWHRDLPQSIWWHTLEKAMLAFEDLGCAELLG
ncbi:MAG: phosphotransferase [Roseiflexaceae bacterium]